MADRYPAPELAGIELVDVLRAVADPVRLSIVIRLAASPEPQRSATFMDLGVQISTLSHHLRTLREAGLTRTRVEGRVHSVELRRDELDARFPGLIAALVASARAGEHERGER